MASKARGALQLYDEINGHYPDKDGAIYWNEARTYKASISNELWVVLSALMYKVTKEQKYLDTSIACLKWIYDISGVV